MRTTQPSLLLLLFATLAASVFLSSFACAEENGEEGQEPDKPSIYSQMTRNVLQIREYRNYAHHRPRRLSS